MSIVRFTCSGGTEELEIQSADIFALRDANPDPDRRAEFLIGYRCPLHGVVERSVDVDYYDQIVLAGATQVDADAYRSLVRAVDEVLPDFGTDLF